MYNHVGLPATGVGSIGLATLYPEHWLSITMSMLLAVIALTCLWIMFRSRISQRQVRQEMS